MDEPLVAAALVGLGYLLGSLPMGVIVARLTGGTDPRTVGSGRTGGTNVLRAMGPGRAVLVAALDVAKGAVAILVARTAGADESVQALAGLAAVLGAWKSVFLRFGGGRGVGTGVGGMLVVSPLIVLISIPVFVLLVGASGYVSLGSLLGTAFGAFVSIVLAIDRLARPGLAALHPSRPRGRLAGPCGQRPAPARRDRATYRLAPLPAHVEERPRRPRVTRAPEPVSSGGAGPRAGR